MKIVWGKNRGTSHTWRRSIEIAGGIRKPRLVFSGRLLRSFVGGASYKKITLMHSSAPSTGKLMGGGRTEKARNLHGGFLPLSQRGRDLA